MTRTQQMSADEFISQVIRIGRLDRFNLVIDHGASDLDERVWAEVDLTLEDRTRTYKGNGRSMGLALREVRERIQMEMGY